MMGEAGCEMVDASIAKTSQNYCALVPLADCTFTAFTGTGMTGTWTGKVFPKGVPILGKISAFTADVAVMAYQHT